MKTFGIDEICVDNLLSSRLSSLPTQKSAQIPATYVSDYSSDFNLLSRNNIHVPQIGSPRKSEVPGYVSIEGAQMLQQSSWVFSVLNLATLIAGSCTCFWYLLY